MIAIKHIRNNLGTGFIIQQKFTAPGEQAAGYLKHNH